MNVIDVSSFLLIEDSADSEGDPADFFSLCPSSIAANIGHKEDDAESCTCDTSDSDDISSLLMEDDKGSGEFCGDGDDSYGLDCSCSTMWLSDADAALGMECSSPFLVDDEKETRMVKVNVNDVDDKLFWEMCIAVGYP